MSNDSLSLPDAQLSQPDVQNSQLQDARVRSLHTRLQDLEGRVQSLEGALEVDPRSTPVSPVEPSPAPRLESTPLCLPDLYGRCSPDQPLVIITTLSGFDQSYSLVPQILDQARAGVRAGFSKVVVCVMVQVGEKACPEIPGVTWERSIPATNWKEDIIDEQACGRLRTWLLRLMGLYPRAVYITHDLVFQSWHLTFAKAIHEVCSPPPVFRQDEYPKFPNITWYHQVHSSVSRQPTEPPEVVYRTTIPRGHKLAAINYTDIPSLARYYNISRDDIVTLPNTRDPLTAWGEIAGPTKVLLQGTTITTSRYSQVYPLSTPRAGSKGLVALFQLFGAIKEQAGDDRCCLILANAHANGDEPRAVIDEMNREAENCGLLEGFDYWWSSKVFPDCRVHGLPRDTIRDLFHLTSIFAFPSISEACGVVGLEAALSGHVLALNRNLPVMRDFYGTLEAIWVNWNTTFHTGKWDPQETARDIIDAVAGSPILKAKHRVLMNHSIKSLALRLRVL